MPFRMCLRSSAISGGLTWSKLSRNRGYELDDQKPSRCSDPTMSSFRLRPDSRFSLLIMFTWYRVLQAEEDAASAAMVA